MTECNCTEVHSYSEREIRKLFKSITANNARWSELFQCEDCGQYWEIYEPGIGAKIIGKIKQDDVEKHYGRL